MLNRNKTDLNTTDEILPSVEIDITAEQLTTTHSASFLDKVTFPPLSPQNVNTSGDESLPLLANEDGIEFIPAKNPENFFKKYAPTAVQGVLGAIGSGVVILYLGPATTCVERESCGLWLAKLFSKKGAVIVFTAGGLDYAFINMYMSAFSVDKALECLANEPSLLGKAIIASVIIALGGSHVLQSFVISSTTATQSWQPYLTAGGAIPGALFGAAGVAPHILSKIKDVSTFGYRQIVDLFSPIDDVERLHRKQKELLVHEMLKFQQSFAAKVDHLIRHSKDITRSDIKRDFYELAFSRSQAEHTFSWTNYLSHKFGQLVGAGLAASFTAPIVVDTFYSTEYFFDPIWARVLATCFINLPGLYGNFKLSMDFMSNLMDTIVDILQGKPIKSVAYQLHPLATMVAIVVATGGSALSYAFINTLFEDIFKIINAYREIARYTADLAIDIYHLHGLLRVYELALKNLPIDAKAQYLLELEHRAHNPPSLDKFIELVQNSNQNNPEMNKTLGLETAANILQANNIDELDNLVVTQELPYISNSELPIPLISPKPEKEKKSSYFSLSSWCSWFSGSSKADSTPVSDVVSTFVHVSGK